MKEKTMKEKTMDYMLIDKNLIGTETLADKLVLDRVNLLTKNKIAPTKNNIMLPFINGKTSLGLSAEYLESRIDKYLEGVNKK